ncbi:YjdJ family protein [Cytobacillus oceanisediminis]|uniref:YjdJ family protein n=1 Tax=Cytobacillus oceanisediminis TaxID=665099 RepID=UPI001C25114F|nr:YjdJ family protein [Cytobacillus oceanisediminis]MBU8769452.1 YjdJ family protein [Cytobacillus oceanisediminis]
MIRFVIPFSVSIAVLLFSAAVAWYEGSAILDNPWEWRYSTPFTQLLYGVVNNPSDISQPDYFVYASKFQPTFPIIMILSSLYLLILIGYNTLKQKRKWLVFYLTFLGGGLFLISYFTSYSPTVGGHILFSIFIICGLLRISTALIINFQVLNLIKVNKVTN